MSVLAPPIRAEFERPLEPLANVVPERPLPFATRLLANPTLRKGIIVVILAVLWEIAARIAGNDLLLRTFLSTLTSMFNPLPAIAMLPLALLWFGLGKAV